MTKQADSKIISSLEIGSSKVVAVVSEVLHDGVINVLGSHSCPSKGMEQGCITDFEAVKKTIKRVIEQAGSAAGYDIFNVMLSITGGHITSFNEEAFVPLPKGTVTEEDIYNVIETARIRQLPDGLEILHIIPQEYRVDNLMPTKKPLGIEGKRLYANVHLIACHRDWLKNLKNVVESCDVGVVQTVFSGLASDYSILDDDEKERGVCLIDFGGGTMDVLLYTGGALRYSKVVPYAGSTITDYISQQFKTSFNEAENIKVKYGSAICPPTFNADKRIEVAGLGGHIPRMLTKNQLSQTTSVCYTDLLQSVRQGLAYWTQELRSRGIRSELIAGVVITGGGAQIEDIVECAKNVFGSQVRVGLPQRITGVTDYVSKPQYATVLGLLQYSYYNPDVIDEPVVKNPTVRKWLKTVKEKAGKFLRSF